MSSPTTATFLEPPDFFVDAGLGTIAIPGFIAGRGHKVTTKMDVFGARRVPDTEWLQWCGASWVAITKDEAAVRRVKDEIKAARRYKVRLFYFPNQQLRSETYVRHLETNWSAILRHCQQPGPLAVCIYADRLEPAAPRPR